MAIVVADIREKFPEDSTAYSDTILQGLIDRAVELVNFATRGQLQNQLKYYRDSTDRTWYEYYTDIEQRAVMAQMEYWFYVGAETDLVAKYKSYMMGNSRIEYELTTISPRTYRVLRMGGLMNVGVSL